MNHYNDPVGVRFISNVSEFRDIGQNGELTDGRPHIFSVRVEQGRGYRGVVRVDGRDGDETTTADVRSKAKGVLRLGVRFDDTYALHGDIAEVLIYRRALSRKQRQHTEAYLADKYGVTKRARQD